MCAAWRYVLPMPANTQRYDVAIVGGGMIGLTLGIALAREGMRVALVERMPMQSQLAPAFDGRVSAIALSSKNLLNAIGAWDDMSAGAEPILDIRVSDGDSPFFLHYDHQEVGDAPFGWIVENRHIRHALMQAAARYSNLEIIAPATIADVTWSEGAVTLSLGGWQVEASLVIAADGKDSELRKRAGIQAISARYDQTAIVCTIAHTLPHHGLAQERFLPAGPFAVLPMRNNRSSLVWVEKAEHAPVFLRLPEAECVQEIRERVGDYLGEIQLAGPRFAYPLSLGHAASYTGKRLALAGDAAHAIHPIAGQGVNLGFRDVAVLAEVLAERFRLGLDIGAADGLAAYVRWRRFDNLAMLAVTDGLTRLFGSDAPPVKLARGLGLWAVSKAPPLKRLFMRHAMGLTGDLPRLLRDAA